MKNYLYHVDGTHCKSCKMLIEDIVSTETDAREIHMDLKNKQLRFVLDNDDENAVFHEFSNHLKPHGYALSREKKQTRYDSEAIWLALPIGFAVLALFFLLQKSGWLDFGFGGSVTPFSAFFIGVVASLSSCLAIVGGLVLSLSAEIAQDGKRITSRAFVGFHAGRFAGFAIGGGLLGLVGGAVGISYIFSSVLGLVTSCVMIALGLHLLGLFANLPFTLPANTFRAFKKSNHPLFAPVLTGIGTFFLPCGFTQSMQVAALGSGSWWLGSAIMLGFVLGTFPMLALLSFGSASFAHSKYASVFFKSAGIVVIGLGIFAILTGLAGLGIIPVLLRL